MQTRLQVINRMLRATGTRAVSSQDTAHPSYTKANAVLEERLSTELLAGWWFNRSVRTLRQNTDGEVIIPGNTLSVDPTNTNSSIVQRGTRLYDKSTGTFQIGKDVEVVLIEAWTFEELPAVVSNYVAARAVYNFYRDDDGDEPKLSGYENEAAEALGLLRKEHIRNADINYFKGGSYRHHRRMHNVRRLPTRDTHG